MTSEIPASVKVSVRAVLQSKDGGVLVSDFAKDYKILVQESLPYRKLGFDNFEDFFKAMQDVVRLEYSKKDMAYRLYGIGDPDVYSPSWVDKGQRPGGQRRKDKHFPRNKRIFTENKSSTNMDDDECTADEHNRYSIIYPRSKTPNFTEQDVRDMFKETGDISKVHMIERWIFVRYMTKEEAVKAKNMFKDELDVRFPAAKNKDKNNSFRNNSFASASDNPANTSTATSMSVGSFANGSAGSASTSFGSTSFGGKTENKFNNSSNSSKVLNDNQTTGNTSIGSSKWVGSGERNSTSFGGSSAARPVDVSVNRSQLNSLKPLNDNQVNTSVGSFAGGRDSTSFGGSSAVRSVNVPDRKNKSRKKQNSSASEDEGNSKSRHQKNSDMGEFQVYVGNLATEVTETDLDELIENRVVSRSVIKRLNNGVKIVGFITFTSPQDAEDVINKWNGQIWHGRNLLVRPGKQSQNNPQDDVLNVSCASINWKGTDNVNDRFTQLKITTDQKHNMNSLKRQVQHTNNSTSLNQNGGNSSSLTQLLQGHKPSHGGLSSNNQNGIISSMLKQNTSRDPNMPLLELVMPPLEPLRSPIDTSMPHLEPMMPPLEPINSDMPPLEPMMPPLEPLEVTREEEKDEPTEIFVGNFPAGTTERELYALFIRYGVKEIRMMNNSHTTERGCTRAFIVLESLDNAVEAILDLDQTDYLDRKIKVAAPRGNAVLHQIVENRIEEFMSDSDSVSIPNSNRTPRKTGRTRSHNRSTESTGMSFTSKCGDVTELSSQESAALLETYSFIVSKIASGKPHSLQIGEELTISVSAWLIDQYYFIQNLNDKESLRTLATISAQIQETENHLGRTKGLGRCAALYKNEWYRAWIIREDRGSQTVKVFYIDYGNLSIIPSKDTCIVSGSAWELPPQAKPVKIDVNKDEPHEKELVDKALNVQVQSGQLMDKCTVFTVNINEIIG